MARTGDLVPKEKAFMVIPEHIRHAQELLSSANLLIRENHYQTGFALATYASESIIKALILWSYRIGFIDEQGYENLEKVRGDRHAQRQKIALVLIKEMAAIIPLTSMAAHHRKAHKIRKKRGHYSAMEKVKLAIPTVVNDFQEQWHAVDGTFWENAKRQALYVDWDSTNGRIPEPLDWQALALEAQRTAKGHLDYLREINKPFNKRRFFRHANEIKSLIQLYMQNNISSDQSSS